MLGLGGRQKQREHLLVFTSEMRSLLALSAPLDRCLRQVSQELPQGPVRAAVESAAAKVAAGVMLSDVLAEYPLVFPASYVQSVAAGEKSGELVNCFAFLARYLESQSDLDRKLRRLTVYPLTVLTATAFVVWVLLTQLVPVFEDVLAGVGLEDSSQAPWSMRVLIAVSSVMRILPAWVSLVLGALVFLVVLAATFGSDNSIALRALRRLPWLRRVHEEGTLAILTGVLGACLKSGTPLDQALFTARNTVTEPSFREALSEVARGVQNGEKVGPLLERSGKFPPTFSWLVSMSEEEGQIAGEMLTLSERYFDQARDSIAQLEMVTRPALIVFLCVIVGIVVVTMFTALIKMPGLIPLGGLH